MLPAGFILKAPDELPPVDEAFTHLTNISANLAARFARHLRTALLWNASTGISGVFSNHKTKRGTVENPLVLFFMI